jgi:hypothetical protein
MVPIVPGSRSRRLARYEPNGDGTIRLNITIATAQTPRAEIRRRVRRHVMLRRLRRELAEGQDLTTILRRPSAD